MKRIEVKLALPVVAPVLDELHAVLLAYGAKGRRVLMAVAVGIGFLSHLVLDELYSVQWDGTRVRLKSSSGTALKFFGTEAIPNGTTLALLLLLTPAFWRK